MNNKRIYSSVVFLILLCTQSVVQGQHKKQTKKPNIIFILADDLGFTDMGFVGSDIYQTPNIDQLAADGMYFNNAYSSHPTCQPSRIGLITGKYPARVGAVSHGSLRDVTGFGNELPKEEVTYASALQKAGYKTGHIGKWHIGTDDNSPINRGFDVDIASNEFCCASTFFYPFDKKGKNKMMNELAPIPDLDYRKPGDHLTDCLSDEAVKFINSNKEEPFFLNLWYYAVHTPIEANQDKVNKYKQLITKESKHNNPSYAALVEHLDDGVGKIVEALEKNGIAENTIIVFMSDNGGELRQNITKNDPLREGKGFSYEGGVRVPLIVKWPGVTPENTVSNERVIGFDIYPTMLSMANAKGDKKHNKQMDGVDLTPLLKNPKNTLANREIHFLRYLSLVHFRLPIDHRNRCVETVIKGDWKMLEFFEMPGGLKPFYELYNLKEDPSESTNVVNKYPDKVKELKKSMKSWREKVDAPPYDMEKFYGEVTF